MGKGRMAFYGHLAFDVALGVILVLVVAQSVVHLFVVLQLDRTGTLVDLDRSNGLPDVVSTLALALAALAAGAIARYERGSQRILATLLAAALAVLTVADLFHDGAHPSSPKGMYVILLVAVSAVLFGGVALSSAVRSRLTLTGAVLALATSFLVTGLDRFDPWFERARGDPIAEYQIVAKEGLELLGWALVALALGDEAVRRRADTATPTVKTGELPVPSRRRAA